MGNLHLEFEDLSVSLGSLPISVIRRYDTLYKSESGELGHGSRLEDGRQERGHRP